MNVMYWNCTAPGAGGSFSAEKVDAIGQRIAALQPDIICLDEMSALITGALTADRRLNSMKTSEGAPANLSETYAAVNVNVNPGAHLNTAIFVRKTLLPAVVKVAIGLPQAKWDSDNTKRDLVRAQYMDSQTHRIVSIWFLHANASQRNGAKAASFAAQDVTAANNDIFIGDFNVNAPDLHLYPKAVQTKPALDGYTYSQWAKSAYSNGATQIGSTVDAKPGADRLRDRQRSGNGESHAT
ncbi:endonuclease/exonuclease/phosphatase family protein [Paraburkholderia kirstenboschensis]|uniref:endonuclease/exonuclease/phosphatase family protein n=1 Tax=Paraburkholderia kirstenboschensis TaxID=1245436 RepID=UPI000ACC66F2|nr:endonuclease/exonuclease/phosphatase family protein [Paraburkholderia kirstenboschensis]